MNVMIKSIARGAIVGLGLVGASVALADDHGYGRHGWGRDWNDNGRGRSAVIIVNRGYSQPRYAEYYDYARVVDVDPIVTRVSVSRPQRDCWVEDQQVYGSPNTHTPAILGAIIGGVIGHQFDGGGRHNVGSVAGALLGASVGHDAASRNAGVETRSVQRCQTSYDNDYQDRVDGYRVRYVYRGREYCTNMPYDPGSRVQVRVGDGVDVVR